MPLPYVGEQPRTSKSTVSRIIPPGFSLLHFNTARTSVLRARSHGQPYETTSNPPDRKLPNFTGLTELRLLLRRHSVGGENRGQLRASSTDGHCVSLRPGRESDSCRRCCCTGRCFDGCFGTFGRSSSSTVTSGRVSRSYTGQSQFQKRKFLGGVVSGYRRRHPVGIEIEVLVSFASYLVGQSTVTFGTLSTHLSFSGYCSCRRDCT